MTALDGAAAVFALRMARRIYGRSAKVWGPGVDGLCSNGKIYQATIGDDRYFEDVRFAVIEK